MKIKAKRMNNIKAKRMNNIKAKRMNNIYKNIKYIMGPFMLLMWMNLHLEHLFDVHMGLAQPES